MKRKIAILIILCWIILLSNEGKGAISITATGSWSLTINSSDLISGAGSNLISTYTSDTDSISISISETTGSSDNWRVDVKKSDTAWHADMQVDIKRTSDGSGDGGISGGMSYQTLDGIDQSFFSGSGDRSVIHIQLQLSGVSVQIPPDSYSTTVIYTVVDTD